MSTKTFHRSKGFSPLLRFNRQPRHPQQQQQARRRDGLTDRAWNGDDRGAAGQIAEVGPSSLSSRRGRIPFFERATFVVVRGEEARIDRRESVGSSEEINLKFRISNRFSTHHLSWQQGWSIKSKFNGFRPFSPIERFFDRRFTPRVY